MTDITPDGTSSPAVAQEWPEDTKPRPLKILLGQRELIASLVYREIRTRYKQSILGIAWAIINPMMMTVVYTLVFSVFLKMEAPGGLPYAVFVFTALLPWTFFAQTISMGTECLVTNFNLITKIYFPREVLLISLVISKVVDLLLGMLVLIALFVIYHVHVTWMVLYAIPILALQICLMLGIGLIMSSTNLFYRDIKHVVQLLTHAWMYMTPIVYPISKVPGKLLPIYSLNPMVPIIESYKRVALMGQPPMWGDLGIATVISLALLVIGYRTFKKLEPAFAEMV